MDLQTLEAVAANGSKLEKIRLLKLLKHDSLKFMCWALDPMITFGVTADQDVLIGAYRATGGRADHHAYWVSVDTLLSQLYSRKLTGNAAGQAIATLCMSAPTERDLIWTCRVLNKDLRSGFSASTLNKAHPETINTEIPCQLAHPYDPEKHDLRGAWCVEPKLDGLRMVVLDGVAYTRNGRTIDTVGHILKELEHLKDHVLDGEIMGNTEFNEDSGKIRKKNSGPNTSLAYNVFDIMTRAEWDARKTKVYRERRQLLVDLWQNMSPKYIKVVPSIPIGVNPTSEQLFKVRDEMIAMGYEGSMLKDLDSEYVFDRADSVLKLKNFQSIEGKVVGHYEGKKKNIGKLGGFVVEFDGVATNVGGGYSDKQREDFWVNPEQYNERIIEAEFQNKTPYGKLRNPVFIKFRPDRDPL